MNGWKLWAMYAYGTISGGLLVATHAGILSAILAGAIAGVVIFMWND